MTNNVLGIGSTCNNVAICNNRKRHNQPVWYCNEHDDYYVYRNNKPIILTKEEFLGSQKKETNHFNGLCSNCDDRESCSFTKPDSGVWHCAEYH